MNYNIINPRKCMSVQPAYNRTKDKIAKISVYTQNQVEMASGRDCKQ